MKKTILFTVITLFSAFSYSQVRTTPLEASRYLGQVVTICGKIYSGRFLETSATQPTLLNMGGFFPNHTLTVFINKESRKSFQNKPEEYYVNKNVCITGKVADYKGKPEISVTDASAITLEEDEIAEQVTELVKVKRPAETEKPKVLQDKVNKQIVDQKSRTTASIPEETVAEKPKKPAKIKLSTNINLRSGPGLKNSIIATLQAGTVVLIHLTQNEWSYISVDNRFLDPNTIILQGFVKSNLLK